MENPKAEQEHITKQVIKEELNELADIGIIDRSSNGSYDFDGSPYILEKLIFQGLVERKLMTIDDMKTITINGSRLLISLGLVANFFPSTKFFGESFGGNNFNHRPDPRLVEEYFRRCRAKRV